MLIVRGVKGCENCLSKLFSLLLKIASKWLMSSPQILSSYRSQTWQIWEPRIIVILSHLQNCWWEMQMNHFHSAICVFNGRNINTHLSFANYTFPDKRGKKMKCEMRRVTAEDSRQATIHGCQPGPGDFRWTQGFLSTWESGRGQGWLTHQLCENRPFPSFLSGLISSSD